jgi:predicted  nucleic acid-binding Zn-ribbon protein
MIVRETLKTSNRKRYTVEDIKNRVSGEPFALLSNKYVNAHAKLEWLCLRCGNKWFANWHNISYGKGCPVCSKNRVVSTILERRPSKEEVEELLSKRKMMWISGEYINAHSKLEIGCLECGWVWRADIHHIKNGGTGCPNCNAQRKEKHPRWKGAKTLAGYPREWTKELKNEIRDRDCRKCQFPNCYYSDLCKNQKLHVHHIDGVKTNCKKENLISLCNKHHMYIESNNPREWEDYFYSITKHHEFTRI